MDIRREQNRLQMGNKECSELVKLIFLGLDEKEPKEIDLKQAKEILSDMLSGLQKRLIPSNNGNNIRYIKNPQNIKDIQVSKDVNYCLDNFYNNCDEMMLSNEVINWIEDQPEVITKIISRGVDKNILKAASQMDIFDIFNKDDLGRSKNLKKEDCAKLIKLIVKFTNGGSDNKSKRIRFNGDEDANNVLDMVDQTLTNKVRNIIINDNIQIDMDRDYIKELMLSGLRLSEKTRLWLQNRPDFARVVHIQYINDRAMKGKVNLLKYLEDVKLVGLNSKEISKIKEKLSKEWLTETEVAIKEALEIYPYDLRAAELEAKVRCGFILRPIAKEEYESLDEKYIEIDLEDFEGRDELRKDKLLTCLEYFKKYPDKAIETITELIAKAKNKLLSNDEKWDLIFNMRALKALQQSLLVFASPDDNVIPDEAYLLSKYYLGIISKSEEEIELLNAFKKNIYDIRFVYFSEQEVKIINNISKLIYKPISHSEELEIWNDIKKFLPEKIVNKKYIKENNQ